MKKNLKLILFLLIINIFGISIVGAATNPYKEAGPYGTNCTWYAWKMANEKGSVTLPGWGNAKDWYNDAKKDGYTVGTTPKDNSIIVWGNWTSYGHVGYVEAVAGNILYVWDSSMSCIDRDDSEFQDCMANSVSEESDKICYANAKHIACEYTISPDEFGITGYIYLDIAPKKTTTANTQNSNTPSIKENTIPKDKFEIKSSDASLNNIDLSEGNIDYDENVLEYSIEVENEIETFSISATPNDKKATVTGTGEYKLNEGLNEIKLVVNAEDNSTKEYIIKVMRKEKVVEDFNQETNINTISSEKVISKKDNKKIIILISSTYCLIIVIFFILFMSKKNKKVRNKK